MQNIFKTTVTCPKCGAQSEFTIYNFVNEKEQPGVGAIIGDFNAHLHICPKCNTRVAYPYPTIYEDLGNNVVFAYGTSKAAINYLTKLIAVHEAKNNVRCNAVLPGMTATEAVEKNLTEEFRSLFLKHTPLGRMALPEEIAAAVVYLASDESAYTTGQILAVSGGFGMATPVYGELSHREFRR